MKCIDKRLSVIFFAVALFAVTSLVGCKTKAGAQSLLLRPENRKPELVRPARSYRIIDERTFPGYTKVQTADPLSVLKLKSYPIVGMWRTPKATYVEYVCRPYADWWWTRFESETYLRDHDTGDCYKLRDVEYFPLDTCFFICQQAGQRVKFVLVFPPLPDSVKKVDYIAAGGQTRDNMDIYDPVLDIDVRKLEEISLENAQKPRSGKIIY